MEVLQYQSRCLDGESLMVIYVHKNGQGDFRKPVRAIVGPTHYRTPQGVFPIDGPIPNAYTYQQPQLEKV